MITETFPEVGAYEVLSAANDNTGLSGIDGDGMLVPDFELDITPCSPRPDGSFSCP